VSEVSRGKNWVGWLTIPSVLAIAVVASVLRHIHPRLFTSEDISTFGTALTLAATLTAVRAAQASRDAAKDSRRALQLHFRPGDVRVQFHVRDPKDPNAQMPWNKLPTNPPLWISLVFWQPTQALYEVLWVGTDGETRRMKRAPHPGGEADPIRLDGLVGREESGGSGINVVAAIPHLVIRCVDDKGAADWVTDPIQAPTPVNHGIKALRFEVDN
jgi:hypothetical protein